jgi:hypothetical protein
VFHRENKPPSDLEIDDRDKHEKLIGQLKSVIILMVIHCPFNSHRAAEARNRIRIMRLRYETNMVSPNCLKRCCIITVSCTGSGNQPSYVMSTNGQESGPYASVVAYAS